jgi:hypothetical protein
LQKKLCGETRAWFEPQSFICIKCSKTPQKTKIQLL